VEKTRWQAASAGLQVAEARVRGSGAGMDPPEGSVFRDGWRICRPTVGPQGRLVLAASGATGEGWTPCAEGRCALVRAGPADPAVVTACRGHG